MSPIQSTSGSSAVLTRGVSKVAQSNLQVDISRGFPSVVLPTLKPITSEICSGSVIGAEVKALNTKVNNSWFVTPSTQKTVHIMEYLLPINWTRLKTVATYTKVLPKRIRGLDNSGSLSPVLVKMVNDYLLGNLKDSPQDFLKAYESWLQVQVDQASSKIECLQIFSEDRSQAQFKKQLYNGFGQLHTASICMHKLSELAGTKNSKLRERAAYLMQAYRYKDALLTSGVKFFIDKFSADLQQYIQSEDKENIRPFRNALYTNPNSSLARLVRIAVDLSGVEINTSIANIDPKALNQIDPKLARLLRYSERVYKEEQPPTFIIITPKSTAEDVYNACSASACFADKQGALMLANTSQLKRANTLTKLDDGSLDFIVTSELEKVPNSLLKGKIRLVFMSQRTAIIRDYPWIESLLNSADEVRAVLMPIADSSDQSKRARIKRVGQLPELKEVEFNLTSPDLESNLQAAQILYPNVRMLFAISQKINGIYNAIQHNKRLSKDEVKEFSEECAKLHEITTNLITRISDKRKFQKDLTSHYLARLTSAWSSLACDGLQNQEEDPIRVFATFMRALQTSSGSRTKTPSIESTIHRQAFSNALHQFIEQFESQYVLPFEPDAPSPLNDPRLEKLLRSLTSIT